MLRRQKRPFGWVILGGWPVSAWLGGEQVAPPATYRRTWTTPYYEDDPRAVELSPSTPPANPEDYQDPPLALAAAFENPLLRPEYRDFQLAIVVSKSQEKGWGDSQTLRVYQGSKGLIYCWRVSTGKPGWETPCGYFQPTGYSSCHVSQEFGTPMPWALFFSGGMAIHGTASLQGLKELGRPTSHGCIRLEPSRAERLFHLAGLAGSGRVPELDPGSGAPTGRFRTAPRVLISIGPPDPRTHAHHAAAPSSDR